ncbi:unnamed protein product [Mytilus edulis]|uniref:C1q domain-containing protein n=1 Tax=Mytilus edulis TaxID=6550 RepID=A0A8S3PVL5_MYTED|nr:unnamed protein product [Mytilus edulis]
MGFSLVFVIIIPYVFLVCDGFLLDDRNKPATTSRSLLTDENYNALFNLIVHERQSRAKLEQQLARIERELTATQQGVTDIYHTSTDNNNTLENQAKIWNEIRSECNHLNTENDLLKLKVDSIEKKHTVLENYTKVLEHEVASLQQLKGVTDLQTVLTVRNETNILREELRDNSLSNDIKNVSETHLQTEFEIKRMQSDMQIHQNVTFKHLQDNLELERKNMSNRAAFTVCASEQSYFPGGTILFPYVQTRFGVRNSSLSALGSSGKYTCDEAGLYLISGFIMTKTTGYVFLYLKKNGYIIGRIYFSVTTNGNSYQTSTFWFYNI